MGVRRGFLWTLKNTLNRATLRAARRGSGSFSLIRHVGRTSGATYETPLLLATVPEGFVAELTYGPDVDWYRNIVAAGRAVVVHHGREYEVTAIEPFGTSAGLRAFGGAREAVLKVLRKREFRLLRADVSGGGIPVAKTAES